MASSGHTVAHSQVSLVSEGHPAFDPRIDSNGDCCYFHLIPSCICIESNLQIKSLPPALEQHGLPSSQLQQPDHPGYAETAGLNPATGINRSVMMFLAKASLHVHSCCNLDENEKELFLYSQQHTLASLPCNACQLVVQDLSQCLDYVQPLLSVMP